MCVQLKTNRFKIVVGKGISTPLQISHVPLQSLQSSLSKSKECVYNLTILCTFFNLSKHFRALGKRRGAYRVFVGKPEGKNRLEELGVERTIILNRVFKKYNSVWTGLIWLRTRTCGGLF
jgi:hypothetical protein